MFLELLEVAIHLLEKQANLMQKPLWSHLVERIFLNAIFNLSVDQNHTGKK